jgi:hypothetical protein
MLKMEHFLLAGMAMRTIILSILTILVVADSAMADEYFAVVFGAQSDPKRPKFSHSWATFVRVGQDSPEILTISWMPCKLEITPNRPIAEQGVNLDLQKSFEVTLANCEEVMAWGPYRIDCDLFERAKKHQCRLCAGDIRYKTIDAVRNPLRVSNCIHALTVFTENRRVRIGRANFGHVASYWVMYAYRDWLCCPREPQCWIAEMLGLDQYPIQWRTLEQGVPRSDDN